MSLHAYLENNKGSDEDFDKVDALLDQLSAKSKDKAALLELTKAILVLNQEIKSKSIASEEASPATNGDKTSPETETSAAAESNRETARDENKPSNTTDSKPAESSSEKETTESTTSTGNQEKPVE